MEKVMKKDILFAFVAFLIFSDPLLAETPKKLEITVVEVKRLQEWTLPSSSFLTVLPMKPKEGYEVALVCLKVKHGLDAISLSGFEAYDEAGNKYKAEVLGYEKMAKQFDLDVPFFVPKGTRLKKFVVKEPSVEVDCFQAALSPINIGEK
jgi:hypothetical protein